VGCARRSHASWLGRRSAASPMVSGWATSGTIHDRAARVVPIRHWAGEAERKVVAEVDAVHIVAREQVEQRTVRRVIEAEVLADQWKLTARPSVGGRPHSSLGKNTTPAMAGIQRPRVDASRDRGAARLSYSVSRSCADAPSGYEFKHLGLRYRLHRHRRPLSFMPQSSHRDIA